MGFVFKDGKPISPVDKATQITNGLLLEQYRSSPNYIEYLGAFVKELDFLFEQVSEVYNGRYLEGAVGAQLDIIGVILQLPRSVALPIISFGFQGVPAVDGFADEATPARGGIFLSEDSTGFSITPLSDELYRRALLAKAYLLNRDSADINLTYQVVIILLNKVPRGLRIDNVAHRHVELTLVRNDVTSQEVALILYMAKYYVPAGVTFTINQV